MVKTWKYATFNAAEPKTLGYQFVKYVSYAFTFQEDITTDVKVSNAGELVVRSEYLISTKEKEKWYCQQNGSKHIVIVSTRTIVHPCLDVSIVKYVADVHRMDYFQLKPSMTISTNMSNIYH